MIEAFVQVQCPIRNEDTITILIVKFVLIASREHLRVQLRGLIRLSYVRGGRARDGLGLSVLVRVRLILPGYVQRENLQLAITGRTQRHRLIKTTNGRTLS